MNNINNYHYKIVLVYQNNYNKKALLKPNYFKGIMMLSPALGDNPNVNWIEK